MAIFKTTADQLPDLLLPGLKKLLENSIRERVQQEADKIVDASVEEVFQRLQHVVLEVCSKNHYLGEPPIVTLNILKK